MVDPLHSQWSPLPFLKAWDDYVEASREILERLTDPIPSRGASISMPIFGAWADLAKSLGMPSDVNPHTGFKPDALIAQLAPTLGWSRDYQRIVQRMLEIGSQFQLTYTEFLKQGAAIGEQALHATQRRTAADAQLASSPVAAYEAWIESAEAAYAQAAHGDAFSRSLGELCNLLSAFKVERGKLLDALARHLDLPSRAEVDCLHRQVRELNLAVGATAVRPSHGKTTPRKTRKRKGK
jgi:hypothetical protein